MENLQSMHTFVICAYKESAYLEACIQSLKAQEEPTTILMVTSTPNDHIKGLADKYEIELIIHEDESQIAKDWNFAMAQAKTPYVTIAHQDDLYHPEYVSHMMEKLQKSKRPLIAFSDYFELRGDRLVKDNYLLRTKRFLLSFLRIPGSQKSVIARRMSLSMGCSICCPSVTYCVENLPMPLFGSEFRSDLDWEAWERISKLSGEFLFISKALVCHRIHEESETTAVLEGDIRKQEDLQMLKKFWPAPLAKLILTFYSQSGKSNKLKRKKKR